MTVIDLLDRVGGWECLLDAVVLECEEAEVLGTYIHLQCHVVDDLLCSRRYVHMELHSLGNTAGVLEHCVEAQLN